MPIFFSSPLPSQEAQGPNRYPPENQRISPGKNDVVGSGVFPLEIVPLKRGRIRQFSPVARRNLSRPTQKFMPPWRGMGTSTASEIWSWAISPCPKFIPIESDTKPEL